jgi:hypothetical protein
MFNYNDIYKIFASSSSGLPGENMLTDKKHASHINWTIFRKIPWISNNIPLFQKSISIDTF